MYRLGRDRRLARRFVRRREATVGPSQSLLSLPQVSWLIDQITQSIRSIELIDRSAQSDRLIDRAGTRCSTSARAPCRSTSRATSISRWSITRYSCSLSRIGRRSGVSAYLSLCLSLYPSLQEVPHAHTAHGRRGRLWDARDAERHPLSGAPSLTPRGEETPRDDDRQHREGARPPRQYMRGTVIRLIGFDFIDDCCKAVW